MKTPREIVTDKVREVQEHFLRLYNLDGSNPKGLVLVREMAAKLLKADMTNEALYDGVLQLIAVGLTHLEQVELEHMLRDGE